VHTKLSNSPRIRPICKRNGGKKKKEKEREREGDNAGVGKGKKKNILAQFLSARRKAPFYIMSPVQQLAQAGGKKRRKKRITYRKKKEKDKQQSQTCADVLHCLS